MAEVNQDQDDLEKPSALPRKKVLEGRIIYLAIILLLIVGCIGLFLYEQHKVNVLNSKNASLHTTTDSLGTKNKELTTMNANLQKSYTALKNTQKNSNPSANDNSVAAPSTPKATASFSIDSVKVEPRSYFGATDPATSGIELLAVTVTVKNLSSTNLSYYVGDFSAITDAGVVKSALIFGAPMPGEGNYWNNSTIAPGGSDTEVIPFLDSDYVSDGFTTLEFTPTNSPALSLPLPAPAS